ISIDEKLLRKFDAFIRKRKYSNRSEAIRDLIRRNFVEEEWEKGKEVVGSISLVYDHHKRELVERLTELQHIFHNLIISTQHIHLDYNNCFEIIVVKGRAEETRELAQKMQATKGVKYLSLNASTTGKEIL
ncbi:MAG TPA: nickel-responsive transcriptional regulator NikR, partial [Candidatus Omnitrophica bacterium]|nr:nickel-responsive transcriptional regulator NikR [Candidatus Omnitrophota bacterium]